MTKIFFNRYVQFMTVSQEATTETSTESSTAPITTPLNNDLLPKSDECGLGTADQKVYGGHETALDAHPWIAVLKYRHTSNKRLGNFF